MIEEPKNNKIIGILLILGAVLLFIPYTMLTMHFEYPRILRQDTGVILTKFYAGGSFLIWLWWSFAFVGIPLLVAYILIGQKFQNKNLFVKVATTFGIIGLIVQMIGLLRWTFVVPILAKNFANGDEIIKAISIQNFQMIHQFGGVILGEHIGQIFTIAWTVLIASILAKLNIIPSWMKFFGFICSGIYLLAQADLFATVIPGFPAVKLAGFIGSTLWLLWLIILGIIFIRNEDN